MARSSNASTFDRAHEEGTTGAWWGREWFAWAARGAVAFGQEQFARPYGEQLVL